MGWVGKILRKLKFAFVSYEFSFFLSDPTSLFDIPNLVVPRFFLNRFPRGTPFPENMRHPCATLPQTPHSHTSGYPKADILLPPQAILSVTVWYLKAFTHYKKDFPINSISIQLRRAVIIIIPFRIYISTC